MGENCWVPGCGSSRKIKGLYFHKLLCTTREDVEWGKKMEARAYGVVVSMFDFHHRDQGSNPARGGKIS